MRTTGGSKTCYGVMTDRLGSLMSLYTAGGFVQKFSYDAWGNRRNPLTGAPLSSAELVAANSITSRGYTGHEHIDEFGLINKYGEAALTYNDHTSTLYSSYGVVKNGEVVIYGVKIATNIYRSDYPLGEASPGSYLITGEPTFLPGFSAFKWASLWKSVKGIFASKKDSQHEESNKTAAWEGKHSCENFGIL